jgi:hypothetical protein
VGKVKTSPVVQKVVTMRMVPVTVQPVVSNLYSDSSGSENSHIIRWMVQRSDQENLVVLFV